MILQQTGLLSYNLFDKRKCCVYGSMNNSLLFCFIDFIGVWSVITYLRAKVKF